MKLRTKLTSIVLALLTTVAILAAAQTGPARVALESAKKKEVVDGDLNAAIQQYKALVAKYPKERAVVADALIHMAECYQKLGDAESRKIYEQVLRDYADQKDAVATARARLGGSVTAQNARTMTRQILTGSDAFGSVRGAPSPDGRYLTFLPVGRSGLGIRDLREGTSRVLAGDSSGSMYYSAFSPDSRQVAYAWYTVTGKETRYDLRILPLTGGEAVPPRIVYRNEEMIQIRPFGWTPDGKQLLVLRSLKGGTNQIAMVSVQDGSVRVLKSIAWNYTAMSLSPDGRYIAYEALSGDNASPTEIFVLAADGSRETKVVEGPAKNDSPLWSPDGTRILFLSDRTGSTSLWAAPLEEGKPKGPAELVKADIGRVRLQGITKSGTLYYLVPGVLRSNVYTADLDAGMKSAKPPVLATERFINSNSAPAWSPDGQYLAYLSSRGPSTVLVIRTLKTGEERDLSLPRGATTGIAPRWFPDGRSMLVWVAQVKEALYYRVDLLNGKAELLLAAKGASGSLGLGANTITPDGKTIFYIAEIDESSHLNKLAQLDIESRRETVLKTGMFGSLALSPDGTQLALHSFDGTPGGCYLEVMPAGGGKAREVVRTANCNANRLAWSPDNYLLFVRGMNSVPNVVWRVPVAGGEPEQIGISMTGQLMYPQVHPDGRRITFALAESGASEVWTLENFLPARRTSR